MKLMYELPAADAAVFEASKGADERFMYCVPFNIIDDKFVSGYMAITDKFIYKILDGKLLDKFELSHCTDFTTEVMYGNCGFYANIDGKATLLCRFISGRNLPRYAVMCKACEILSEGKGGDPIENSEKERFCEKCGRPYVARTTICPFCQSKKDIYLKLWAMTKGLRLMLFFPLFVAVFSVAFQFIVPYIQRIAVNEYIQPVQGTPQGEIAGFLAIVVAIVSIDLFQRALGVVQGRLSAISGNKFTLMMRTFLFEKIQILSLSSVQRKSTGDLMGRINNDVNVVQSFITGNLPS